MITLVILSIGILALAGMQVSAIKGNNFSKRMTAAVSLAEQTIELLKNTPYDNILSQSATQVTQSSLNFTREVTVNNNTPMNNTLTVTVTIRWTDGSKVHTVPVSTIISRP
jgi:type IV pilus assembly protein PilV